ncbi:MAG: hypothetical protein AB8I08_06400 [Sandaracinaceae bacterium]
MARFRRIWSEHVPLVDLATDRALLDALEAREIQLLFSVQPRQLDDAIRLLERIQGRRPGFGVWPLLDDADGRWLNPDNADAFERWVFRLLDTIETAGLWVDTLALDLEPPIEDVRGWTRGELGAARSWWSRPRSSGAHERILRRAKGKRMEVLATAIPPALLAGRAGRGWQHALGTPLGLGYDVVSAMLYTSLFEGYSLGTLDRPASRALLDRFTRDARARFGVRTSVSLGAVGRGALGDERAYRDVSELREDLAIARHAGVEDLALFDLTGALERGRPERWLDALVNTPPEDGPPPSSRRAQATVAAMMVSGLAFDVARRRWAGGR